MNKRKVLVVDDEVPIRALVRRILEDKYQVFDASNGKLATQVVKREKPDIILLDILMPEMDGYSFLGFLREEPNGKDTPVVIISAVDHTLNKTLGLQMGAAAYLEKPFTAEQLNTLVAKYLKIS